MWCKNNAHFHLCRIHTASASGRSGWLAPQLQALSISEQALIRSRMAIHYLAAFLKLVCSMALMLYTSLPSLRVFAGQMRASNTILHFVHAPIHVWRQ